MKAQMKYWMEQMTSKMQLRINVLQFHEATHRIEKYRGGFGLINRPDVAFEYNHGPPDEALKTQRELK
jgi:hypothetical protein